MRRIIQTAEGKMQPCMYYCPKPQVKICAAEVWGSRKVFSPDLTNRQLVRNLKTKYTDHFQLLCDERFFFVVLFSLHV